MATKILVTRRIHPEAISMLRGAGLEIKYFDVNQLLDQTILLEIIPGFDAILTCVTDKLHSDILTLAPKLRVISNMAAGLDNIDVRFAKSKGIQVFNTPDVVTASTADMTLTIAFALMRKIIASHTFVINGEWKGWDPEIFLGRTFSALTWGIVGFGKIGKAVAKRLTGFEIPVLYFDPVENSAIDNATKTDLSILLKKSDVVSLHIPLTQQTHCFFDWEKFSLMKPSAYFINMARGGVINQIHLVKALRENIIAGAALDVFDPEPIPIDHEILTLNNVIFTPHIGTATQECRREMAILAAKNIINYFK